MKERNLPDEYKVKRYKSRHGKGLGKDYIHYGVHGGGNSGFQAINLAYHMGAQVILLLGLDMFGSHYFGEHPDHLCRNSPFKDFIRSFESIGRDVEIINCTRKTALTCFPLISLDDIF